MAKTVTELDGEVRELRKALGDLTAQTADLRAEDRVLGTRLTAVETTVEGAKDDQRETDRRVEDVRRENDLLKQDMARLRADLDKWGNRVWALVAALVVALTGLAGTAALALVGLKK